MKKKLTLLSIACVACLALALLAGCSSNSQASSSDSGEDKSADISTLVVGFDNSYPPYGFMDENNQPTGIDLDLATEVAKRNGWDIQLEPINWDSKDALLNQGSINCIWNGFTMEGREGKYTFSEPYMLNEQVVVVKKDSGINSLEDLAGKTVVTQADSAALDVLEGDKKDLADTFKDLQTLPDYNNAFMQLESGIVDAVACDLSIAQYQIAAKPDAYTQLDPLSTEHYAVGFKLGDEALAQKVTDTLRDMYNDGTVATLCDKYAQYGVNVDNWVLK
ncbi:MAG: amino acid ABC transporter substrate-binding protein [Eggerthellaceae bacterium]